MWVIQPTGLVEPSIAPEIYVDGIGAIEVTNGIARIYLVTEQSGIETSLHPQKIVAVKIVGPLLNIPATIAQLAMCAPFLWGERPRQGPQLVR